MSKKTLEGQSSDTDDETSLGNLTWKQSSVVHLIIIVLSRKSSFPDQILSISSVCVWLRLYP